MRVRVPPTTYIFFRLLKIKKTNFQTYDENIKSQANKLNEELEITKKLNKSIEEDNQLSPVNDLEVIEISTPVHDDDSDKSVVEDTPQK